MSALSPERRHFVRVVFDAEATLSTTASRLSGKVVDLSLKGALIELHEAASIESGEPCLLAVQLGDDLIKISGETAHVEGRQVGVQCRCIDLESITHLRRLIEMNLGGGKLLERELKALIAA